VSDFKAFKLSLEVRIDWSDLDMYEHVNNLTFMRFLQSGRVNFWEATGIHEHYHKSKKGTILVSTSCDFKKTLNYPGSAKILTKLESIGNSSFSLKHLILDGEQHICAEGLDTVVYYDFKNKGSIPIPKDLRAIIEQY